MVDQCVSQRACRSIVAAGLSVPGAQSLCRLAFALDLANTPVRRFLSGGAERFLQRACGEQAFAQGVQLGNGCRGNTAVRLGAQGPNRTVS